MPISPARAAAFEILLRIDGESAYASELLHSATHARLSARDHRLATELVMGVLRWQLRLDDEIAKASSKPPSKLDLEVLIALRLALFQFRLLDRVPQHAALDESVELVKRAQKRSAAPFVNAVLRRLARDKEIYGFEPGSYDSPESIAHELAHPLWLVGRWASEYGVPAAREICQYDQTIPPTTLRLRVPVADAELQQERIRIAPGHLLRYAGRVISGDVTKTHAFREGRLVIQDEGSQLVANLVDQNEESHPGRRILDCCAAPGGKTLAIADRNPNAAITAVELHSHRARLLEKILPAADAANRVHVIVADAQRLPFTLAFDRVLADVPCSGTGTLARNPEIKWRLRPDDLQDLHARQCAILRSALAQVAWGGRLVYSTCSLEREENECVIEQIRAENHSLRLIDCLAELERMKLNRELLWSNTASLTRGPYLRTIPGIHPCDGFFAAILERM
jgi:16S rRNA (cytosine967-C5)-methyltransferase